LETGAPAPLPRPYALSERTGLEVAKLLAENASDSLRRQFHEWNRAVRFDSRELWIDHIRLLLRAGLSATARMQAVFSPGRLPFDDRLGNRDETETWIAEQLLELRLPVASLSWAAQVDPTSVDDPILAGRLVAVLIACGDTHRSGTLLDAFRDRTDRWKDYYAQSGQLLRRLWRLDRAFESAFFDGAISGNHGRACLSAGVAKWLLGELDDAWFFLQQASSSNHSPSVRSLAFFNMARTCRTGGDMRAARSLFEQAVSCAPSEILPRVLFDYAWTLRYTGRRREALAAAGRGASIEADGNVCRPLLEYFLLVLDDRGDSTHLVRALAHAIRTDTAAIQPHKSWALLLMAAWLRDSGHGRRALHALRVLLSDAYGIHPGIGREVLATFDGGGSCTHRFPDSGAIARAFAPHSPSDSFDRFAVTETLDNGRPRRRSGLPRAEVRA
jgi:hypothetical protein